MPAATAEQKAALVRAGAGTRWAAGNPGRPPRRGPALPTPQELAAPHADEALKVALGIMRDEDENVFARLQCVRMILDTAKPDDEDKLLKLLEAKLLELQEEAAARRAEMAATPTETEVP